jgi:hypothetical protein
MKKDFRVIDLPRGQEYIGPCLCKRCGKEFSATELVFGVRTKGHEDGQRYARWYCPTEDCNGYINSGVYYRTTSKG